MIFTAFTLSGPAIGVSGSYLQMPLLFWIGFGIAALNLFMNVASGAMRFPILPIAFTIAGAVIWNQWMVGAAVGLLVWTAIEGLSELLPRKKA